MYETIHNRQNLKGSDLLSLKNYLEENQERGLASIGKKTIQKIHKNIVENQNGNQFFSQQYTQSFCSMMKTMKQIYSTIENIRKLPYIQFLLKEFQSISKNNSPMLAPENTKHQNEKKIYRPKSSFLKLQQNKKDYIKLQQCIKKITNEKQFLPNLQCLNCSPFFYQNHTLSTSENVVNLSNAQGKNIEKISEAFCSLLNEKNGGFIFIGVQNKKFVGKVYSVKKKNQQKQKINQICQNIQPKIDYDSFDVNYVPLLPKPTQENQEQKELHIIRIYVQPQKMRGLFSITDRKGGELNTKIYKRKGSIKILEGEEIYDEIQKMNRKKRKMKTKNHICTEPLKLKQIYETTSDTDDDEQERINFKNECFLKIGSSKNEKILKEFQTELKALKCEFKIVKPDEREFRNGNNLVWHLYHSDSFYFIEGVLKKVDKARSITPLKIFSNLLVKSKQNGYQFNNIINKLSERIQAKFKKELRIVSKDENNRLILSFASKKECSYAFILLLSQKVSTQFVPYLKLKEN